MITRWIILVHGHCRRGIWLVSLVLVAGGLVSGPWAAESTSTEIQALNQQFDRLYKQGQFEETVPVLERLLEIQKQLQLSEHPSTAAVFNNLALVRRYLGDYAAAEAAAMNALGIYKRALGTNDPQFATVLFNIGGLFQVMENYAKAEAFYRQALQIFELPPATNDLVIAGAWVNLAGVHLAQGDFGRAEPLLLRALKTYDDAGLTNHPNTAICLNNLGNLYQRLRDYPGAQRAYERSLQIHKALSKSESREVAAGLANLAALYWAKHENGKAEHHFLEALHMFERTAGTNHPQTAGCLQNLAVLYRGMNKHPEAEALYRRALSATEASVGTNHYRYAAGLNNLAVLFRNMGATQEALACCERAVAILKATVGLDSSRAIQPLKTLAYLKADLGDRAAAVEAWRTCRAAEDKQTARILSFTSEPQRLQFQRSHHFSELIELIGSAPDAAEVVLRNKAIVLDSLLEDQWLARVSVDPEVRSVIEQLHTAGRRLDRLGEPRTGNTGAARRQTAVQALEDEISRLQKELARRVNGSGNARRALTVTVPQVQAAIPPQSVLLEWVLYRHYLRNEEWESRYGVVVIPSANTALRGRARGEPAWIPIAPSKEVEDGLKRYQAAIRGAGDDAMLRTIYLRLFAPIEKVLPTDIRSLVISPDGELNFLSFATLLGPDDRFLGEKYFIHYVSSGRDLMRERPSNPTRRELLVFANPDFGASAPDPAQSGSNPALTTLDQREYRHLSLAPLPGAGKEAGFLSAKSKLWRMNCKVYPGLQATEAELRAVSSPHILHLGTHGFFLPQPDMADSSGRADLELFCNPMHRSGLALAGAQWTFAAWMRGESPDPGRDGVLTAQEVAALDLQQTWLVVLSACDSGGGEARAGEGVLGLRRGFMMAGAQNLLMTLAPISDQATVGLLEDFYLRAMETGNAPRALAEVQRTWLVKIRQSKGTIEAVKTAGPFVLTFQGKTY